MGGYPQGGVPLPHPTPTCNAVAHSNCTPHHLQSVPHSYYNLHGVLSRGETANPLNHKRQPHPVKDRNPPSVKTANLTPHSWHFTLLSFRSAILPTFQYPIFTILRISFVSTLRAYTHTSLHPFIIPVFLLFSLPLFRCFRISSFPISDIPLYPFSFIFIFRLFIVSSSHRSVISSFSRFVFLLFHLFHYCVISI